MKIPKKDVKLIITRGKTYKPALLPLNIERGKLSECFDWCALQAMKHPEYSYVEGLASNPEDPENYILHAWLTDGVHAYDPTWQATKGIDEKPVPSHYIGIEMPTLKVLMFMQATGYQGVIANRWRAPKLWSHF